MQLIDLMNMANKGYDDGFLAAYFDQETGGFVDNPEGGDTLARFIVIELNETFSEGDDNDSQIAAAGQALENAQRDLEGVIAMFS